MRNEFEIGGVEIGKGHPAFVIAELSANHNHSIEESIGLVHAAKEAGADAVKLQTYTADNLTIDCQNEHFLIGEGSPWAGRTLHDLYKEASMPWEWQVELKKVADELGIVLFSSPFDDDAVDFLEEIDVPAYKIASFEIVDLALIRRVARTGKPLIISTGMASFFEISEAVEVARGAGCSELALLKCTSAYPAPIEEANLARMAHMAEAFGVPVGLSDHTLGGTLAVAAVTLGGSIIEKHLTRSRLVKGPDSDFSMEPSEFGEMVANVREAEAARGEVTYELTAKEKSSKVFRRSLFVVVKVKKGEVLTAVNVRSIRPGSGLPPRFLDSVLGRVAAEDIDVGTPLSWNLIQ